MLPPFYQVTTFFFIPYYGNNDNPCYNDTLRKERELSLLPSFTAYGKTEKNVSIQTNLIHKHFCVSLTLTLDS